MDVGLFVTNEVLDLLLGDYLIYCWGIVNLLFRRQRGEVKGVITKKANQFMNSLLVNAKQALSSSSSSSSPSSSSSLRSRKSYRVATTKDEDSQMALASDEHLEREEN